MQPKSVTVDLGALRNKRAYRSYKTVSKIKKTVRKYIWKNTVVFGILYL